MNLSETSIVVDELKTPQDALDAVRAYLTETLPELNDDQQGINQPFAEHLKAYQQLLAEVRQYWLANREEIVNPIINELNKKVQNRRKKSIKSPFLSNALCGKLVKIGRRVGRK